MSDIEAQAMKKLAILLLMGAAITLFPSVLHAVEEVVIEEYETESVPTSDAMTAIEIIIGKRIPETVLEDGRPHHVYRPKTPIYHQNHPENEPEAPAIRKHLLVDHPELNNNQGRTIRTPAVADGEPSRS
ncbi:hypothetical protein [Grimontia sp. NTOU-MAR1]|uniref:hypothetical protein n=1 Tax=Grimontia sp. NTOU-MAR1 TaxID=3111011 RepID=UPI002DB7D4F9|nr:hypothetical protein [Grimontia sp. NTOU-MAR1]WRV98852.1 hypothetical protein VP504_05360 [Grimontia sp. NTOU-MAR1]